MGDRENRSYNEHIDIVKIVESIYLTTGSYTRGVFIRNQAPDKVNVWLLLDAVALTFSIHCKAAGAFTVPYPEWKLG